MPDRRPLDAAGLRDWLRLARVGNVGPVSFRRLLRRFGTARKALDALPELARRGGSAQPFPLPSPLAIEDEISALEKLGGRFIALCEPDYPEALSSVEDAPPVIAVLGSVEILRNRCIGVVGARNASLNGRRMAERLARDLGAEGMAVVSGLARGIDAAAHTAALDSGTIAVMAGGVDFCYPEENRPLYEKIVESGAAVSDQPLRCEPRARLFPKRNRIISGLSLGVIVVEAAAQSGSLITARLALEQGREVFAVPGSPLDPRAAGTNSLLKQGAILVESAGDVISHIQALPRSLPRPGLGFEEPETEAVFDVAEADGARRKILENLGPSPVPVDELVRRCQLSPALVLSVLLELELAGRCERMPGQQVALVA